MSEVQPYFFPATGQEVRTVLVDGEPWFVAADVASVLCLDRHRDAMSALDEDEKSREIIASTLFDVVSEAGLYSLILRSRKPEAKAFKRWVTHEVLPTIRRTGRYAVEPDVPRSLPEALRAYAAEVEAHESTRAELAEAAPKAEAWQVLASADGDYSVREAAFILNRDPAISTGQGRLFRTLREFGVIDGHNRPYAAHERHARLRPREYTNRRTQETALAEPQTRITVDGLRYLHRRMGGAAPLDFQQPLPLPS